MISQNQSISLWINDALGMASTGGFGRRFAFGADELCEFPVTLPDTV
jgi:hypothetical protein